MQNRYFPLGNQVNGTAVAAGSSDSSRVLAFTDARFVKVSIFCSWDAVGAPTGGSVTLIPGIQKNNNVKPAADYSDCEFATNDAVPSSTNAAISPSGIQSYPLAQPVLNVGNGKFESVTQFAVDCSRTAEFLKMVILNDDSAANSMTLKTSYEVSA